MKLWSKAAAVLAAFVVVGTVLPDDQPPAPAPAAAPAVKRTVEAVPSPSASPPPVQPPAASSSPAPEVAAAATPAAPRPRRTQAPLLMPAGGGDGDSWRDTEGREYRLGMVNTPEVGECYAAEATAKRKALVAKGFRASVYASDRYGRGVSVVTTADGLNLNVHLARYGFADDRYLAQFRHENPALATQLDAAFAAARAEGRGLWSRCAQAQGIAEPAAPAPAPAAASDCHPDYATCIPLKGDGSGRGAANDLDCGDIDGAVRLRRAGVDPYRLDADGDGVGCDS